MTKFFYKDFYHLTQVETVLCSVNTLDIFQTGVISILCQKWFTETSLHSTSTTTVLELYEQTALSLSHLEHAHTGCIHTHTMTHTCMPHTLCAWCVSITMLAVCMSTTLCVSTTERAVCVWVPLTLLWVWVLLSMLQVLCVCEYHSPCCGCE